MLGTRRAIYHAVSDSTSTRRSGASTQSAKVSEDYTGLLFILQHRVLILMGTNIVMEKSNKKIGKKIVKIENILKQSMQIENIVKKSHGISVSAYHKPRTRSSDSSILKFCRPVVI